MTYGLIAGLLILAWGVWTVWSHIRECPESAAYLTRFGAAGLGAGLALSLFCGYEIAETMMLTSVSVPLVATYQRCIDLEDQEIMDMSQLGALGPSGEAKLQADDDARAKCATSLHAYASVGAAILSHGESK
jgi:hypothetical protein